MIQQEASLQPTQFFPVLADAAQAMGAYTGVFPEAVVNKSAQADQAYDDYCRLREAGEAVDPDEYCERFPSFKTSLWKLIEAHRLFEENPHYLDKVEAPTWPKVGDTFLGYQLIEQLGRGAFARVFLAREPALGGRPVALKVSTLQGLTEADTLGRLAHPNIVPIHSVQHDARSRLSAICMPYLGRTTLCDVLDRVFASSKPPARAEALLQAVRDERLPGESPDGRLQAGTFVDGTLHLGVQLAEALAFMHAQGVCHRDLKPSNVLVTPSGRPMLLDFNLSGRAADAERLGGTLPYMAAEQLIALRGPRGDGRPVEPIGAAADVFSFGVILYELLAGVHPFGPVSLKTPLSQQCSMLLERHERGPRPIRQANPRVDAELAALLDTCLALEPWRRPSANRLLAELRRHLSVARRTRRWLCDHAKAACAAALVCLATATAAGAWLATRDPYGVRQMNAGRAAFASGDFPLAVDRFGRVLEDEPSLAVEALIARGRAYLKWDPDHHGYLSQALSDFQAADKRQRDGRILALLGYCRQLNMEHDPAAKLYEKALEAGFDSAELRSNLGYCYYQTNQLVHADDHLKHALILQPDLGPALYHTLLLDLKRFTRSKTAPTLGISDLGRVVTANPPSGDLYLEAARLAAAIAGSDAKQAEVVLDLAARAVEHGIDPSRLAADPLFAHLRTKPEFFRLLQAPRTAAVLARPSLLDPLSTERP